MPLRQRIPPQLRRCFLYGCIFAAVLLPVLSLHAASPSAAPVAVALSETRPIIREERVSGTVTSPRNASLSTQVGGMVARMAVDAGDRVEPGQLLLELDRELAVHELNTARAEVESAQAALADARRRLGEGRRLIRDRTIPKSEFLALEAAVDIAKADLSAAQARARQQEARLERYRIKAPFAGVVSRRIADPGEWVSPGRAVLELVAIEGLRFDFRVPQGIFPHLDLDTQVEMYMDALPQQHFAGRIVAIVPVSDPQGRTFLLRTVPNGTSHPAMMPGMSAHAVLKIDTGRTGVVVPRDALLRYPDGRVSVWVLDRADKPPRVHEHQVRLGLLFGDHVEILEGLEAGVPVIVEGNEALQDGQPVSVRSGG